MVRGTLLLFGLAWATGSLAQTAPAPIHQLAHTEPQLELGLNKFALPIIDYRAPDGTWKRGQGIIIGRQISRYTMIGIGFFKAKPRYEDPIAHLLPASGKSKKLSLGFTTRF